MAVVAPRLYAINLSTAAWEQHENESLRGSTIRRIRYCPSCYGKARGAALDKLRALSLGQTWTAGQRRTLLRLKLRLIGNASAHPARNMDGDTSAVCMWDCYRRATMLEPLASDVLRRGVPGDFLEAGVRSPL